MAEKGGYKHFMLKEIYEQPRAVRETVLGRASLETRQGLPRRDRRSPTRRCATIERIVILACGTSWHAALVGKFLIEELARMPVEVDYGSEFRYRDPIVDDEHARRRDHAVGRDGRHARRRCARRSSKGARSIAICNVVGSMATREADGTVYTHAGPEIGVASTKAFTTQLVALHLLALLPRPGRAARSTPETSTPHIEALLQLPQLLEQTLKLRPARSRRSPTRFYERTRLPVPRPRHQLPDRARRRAEAEGDHLHPRRGLSGRRDEARADRADRREHAGRRDRAATTRVREDDRQHAGSEGARRLGHRADDRRRRRRSTSCSIRARLS